MRRVSFSPLFAAPAAAVIILFAVGSYLLLTTERGTREEARRDDSAATADAGVSSAPHQLQSGTANQSIANLGVSSEAGATARKKDSPRRGRPGRTVTFALTSATRSVDESRPLLISKNTKSIRLLNEYPTGRYERYRAALSPVEGSEIWEQKLPVNVPVKKGIKISPTVPARLFKREDYTLRVLGINSAAEPEVVDQYYFRVSMK